MRESTTGAAEYISSETIHWFVKLNSRSYNGSYLIRRTRKQKLMFKVEREWSTFTKPTRNT